jgi:hypothetical protein
LLSIEKERDRERERQGERETRLKRERMRETKRENGGVNGCVPGRERKRVSSSFPQTQTQRRRDFCADRLRDRIH